MQRLNADKLTYTCDTDQLDFDRAAIARVIEQSARMAGDSEKMSTRTDEIGDLLMEANYWAGPTGLLQEFSLAKVRSSISKGKWK